LRDALNATSVKNTVGMLRNYDDKSILLLEGHSDLIALTVAIDRSACQPLVAYGKIEAIEAVEWSSEQGFSGVIALVDRDLVDLVERRSTNANVFYTDTCDLDSLTFFIEGIVERCIETMCTFDSYESATDSTITSPLEIKTKAASMAGLIGHFRLYSARDEKFAPLDKIPFGEIYKGSDITLQEDTLRGVMIGRLKALDNAEEIFDDWLQRAASEAIPPERICQGHDLFHCLSVVVSAVHGQKHRGEFWERIARSHLRIEHLKPTRFFNEIQAWCAVNKRTVWVA